MLSIEHTAMGNAGNSAASFGSLASPFGTLPPSVATSYIYQPLCDMASDREDIGKYL
jgi:hypothetical protein